LRRTGAVTSEPSLRYACATERLPEGLRDRFLQLGPTPASETFLRSARDEPHGQGTAFAFRILRRMLSDYDAYGLLGMYPMHLLDADQWACLLSAAGLTGHGRAESRSSPDTADAGAGDPAPRDRTPSRLLDIGAGSGGVTAALASHFDEVVTTETSRVMAFRLRRRGWRCHRLDVARTSLPERQRFDVISMLNVLDRCAYPLSLLDRCRAWLQDGGRLILALPLPIAAHVHVGPQTLDPEELLPASSGDWEPSLAELVERALKPAGWRVERFARAPYLCRGDPETPVRVLDDAILVCR
jgi:SAM-dependent methyltransferase